MTTCLYISWAEEEKSARGQTNWIIADMRTRQKERLVLLEFIGMVVAECYLMASLSARVQNGWLIIMVTRLESRLSPGTDYLEEGSR